jgi:polysaccharide export outer membrane protein
VVTVPIAESVFVMGAVKKPGEVALKENPSISVLPALASAEGYGETPAAQNAMIVRLVPGSSDRKEIPVDLTKIQNGKAEDIAMRPSDILVVPLERPQTSGDRAIEAAIQTATGVVIWRHP